jgi:hypothetical protein
MPKPLWQPAPFAAVLGYGQDRIQDLRVRRADVSTLARQAVLDLVILRFGRFHFRSMLDFESLV